MDQTIGLTRSSDKGVQTDPTPGCTCGCHTSTPFKPTPASRPTPPRSSSGDPPFRPPFPVRSSSYRNTSTDPYPKRSPTPSPPKQIPSLLNLNIPSSDCINPQTLEFLRATGEFGCWNWGDATYRYLQCQHPRQVFCFGCRRRGITSLTCPKCRHNPLYFPFLIPILSPLFFFISYFFLFLHKL